MTTDTAQDFEARIEARRAELAQQRAAIPADDQLPATASQADVKNNQRRRATAGQLLQEFESAVAAYRALPSTTNDERWRDQLTFWRSKLCTEMALIKSPIRDARRKGLFDNLSYSITVIDRGLATLDRSSGPFADRGGSGYDLTTLRLGELMRESGYVVVGADPTVNYVGKLPWHGSLPEVEDRLQRAEERRVRVEANLDAAVTLEADRVKLAAQRLLERDAINKLIVKVSSDGLSLVAYRDREAFINREAMSPAEMSPDARAAFERMSASFQRSEDSNSERGNDHGTGMQLQDVRG